MNIEIANRLVELRKKNGLSQEELAAKIGLSRQAVSKWERAEASPDTDNLICLAKLYGISLDELLNNDATVEEIAEDQRLQNQDKKFVFDDDDDDEEDDDDDDDRSNDPRRRKFALVEAIVGGCLMLLALSAYLVLGYVLNMWGSMWVLFIWAVALSTIPTAVYHKSFTRFLYPVFITAVYLTASMFTGLWHPLWILFLTVPIFYAIFGSIDKYNKHKKD